ncbi:hypothetical protein [Spirosoma pollinicola]|uniref:Uncharacterized protein n=1 Tax=Spirosoma pollinicola TaxID=2057025 RepID=A0A2K8Z3G9_9BACT|nr:hypothetical protein [Spirosoma pollinicola]AUD04374.1 hypothetical protein CWM47_22530 [Spirosoma pollinicola]
MRRQLIQPYLFVVGIVLTLSSCFNEPNYSNTPAINYEGMFKYTIEAGKGVGKGKRDSVVITVGFKDGDGNIGNSIPLPKADSLLYQSNGNWGSYRIRTFRLVNNKYEELLQAVNNTLYIPDLTKGKPKGAIEGSLDFNQIFQYGTSYQLYPTKFQIEIRDRVLNTSNIVETDTISVPFPKTL